MSLTARVRKRVDVTRLGQAAGHPGIDPRSWVCIARVDDDPDAITLNPEVGWIVDVTFVGGDLDGEGPVPCAVTSQFAGNAVGSLGPITRGALVLVLVVEGDPNANSTIVGYLFNGGGQPPPTTVAGEAVTEAMAMVTHLMRSPHGRREEYDLDWVVFAKLVELVAQMTVLVKAGTTLNLQALAINLGGTDTSPPTEPVIKGQALVTALAQVLGQLVTILGAIGTAVGGIPGGAPAGATIATAVTAFTGQVGSFNAAATAALSLKSKVE